MGRRKAGFGGFFLEKNPRFLSSPINISVSGFLEDLFFLENFWKSSFIFGAFKLQKESERSRGEIFSVSLSIHLR